MAIIQGEINVINKINNMLRNDYLCVPPYGCINGGWMQQAFQITDRSRLKYHVTKTVVLPWRRAFQTVHFYHELEIFKPFAYIIDVATLAFLNHNWVCAYLSLLPVLEGVLIRWEREIGNTVEDNISTKLVKNVLSIVTDSLNLDRHFDNVIKIEKDFLQDVLMDDVFMHGTKYVEADPVRQRFFNRNATLHMFKEPRYVESGLNTANLFLFLDIVADLYLFCNKEEYAYLLGCRTNNTQDSKVESLNKYFSLYYDCAVQGDNNSLLNRLHNTLYQPEQIIETMV